MPPVYAKTDPPAALLILRQYLAAMMQGKAGESLSVL